MVRGILLRIVWSVRIIQVGRCYIRMLREALSIRRMRNTRVRDGWLGLWL